MKIRLVLALAAAFELTLGAQLANAWQSSNSPEQDNVVAHSSRFGASRTTTSPAISTGAMNLDLTSTQATLSAGNLAQTGTLNIMVGGNLRTIDSTSALTPAEFIAAYQVATTGKQNLRIGTDGNAVGGKFFLASDLGNSLTNLLIPQGVKMLTNAAQFSALNMTGDFVNAGKVYVFTTNTQATSASFNASNIYINNSGLLSSVGASNATNINLSLNALNDIINTGAIISSGNLSISAGSGQFTNSGTLGSTGGSVNITSSSSANITFNNAGGTVFAPNGAINFRDASYKGSANLTLNRGDYLSQTLNMYSGSGSVDMNIDQVTGVVNTYAACAHLSANTPNLRLGVLNVTGDPWVNSSGNLDLGATATGGLTYLVATAGGSIYDSVSSQTLDTSAANGNIVLIAGVTATPSGNNLSFTRSVTGGDIILKSGYTVGGNATADITGFTTGGGNVTMIAMTNGVSGSTTGGHIVLPSSVSINTVNGSTAGSVTVIAEASNGAGDAISLGGINAGGSGGSVTAASATANLGNLTVDSTTGATQLTGALVGTGQNGTVTPGAITSGGALTAYTKGTLNLTGANAAASSSITATTINLANATTLATTAGALAIAQATSNLTIKGSNSGTASLSASGGQLSISCGSTGTLLLASQTTGTASWLNLDSDTGIVLNAGSQLTIDQNITLTNTTSNSQWTLTAPTTQLNDGAAIVTATFLSGANIVIHTNELNLGDNSTGAPTSITGNDLTINDVFAGSAGGVKILGRNVPSVETLYAAGTLLINATNGNVTFGAKPVGTFTTIVLDAGDALNVQASGQIIIQENCGVENLLTQGDWTFTAPTLSLADNAKILPVTGTSSLTIHTNNLQLGDGSNMAPAMVSTSGNLIIDDDFIGSLGGLTITGLEQGQETIYANGNMTISSTTDLVFSSIDGTGSEIMINAPSGVQMTAQTQLRANTGMTVTSSSSSGTWSLTAPTIQLNDGATVSSALGGGILAVHTNNLKLGSSSNGGATLSGRGITIDDNGGSTFATTGLTISGFNGGTNSLISTTSISTPGRVVINSSVLFTSSTPGSATALSVETDAGVLIAAGKTMTIDTNMTLQSSRTLALTLNGAKLINNGTLAGTNVFLVSTGVMKLAGGTSSTPGRFNVVGGGVVLMTAQNSIELANSTNLLVSGRMLSITTPSIVMGTAGDSGAVGATIAVGGHGYITLQANTNSTGNFALSLLTGGQVTSGTLNLNGGTVNSTSTTLTMNANTALFSNNSIQLFANGNMNLSTLMSTNGSVFVNTTSGIISLANNSAIAAINGNLTIQNDDTVSGSIQIGSNVWLQAGSSKTGVGNVEITMGSTTSILGKAPANVTVSKSAAGVVLFGTNGVLANAPTNTIYAVGREVMLNTGSMPASAIQLGGNVAITAGNMTPLTSLDLTDASVNAALATAIQSKLVAGIVNVQGQVTSVTLSPANIAPILSAQNIPVGVAMTMVNFASNTPVTIKLSAASTTPQVIVAGKQIFSSKNNAVMNISSSVPAILNSTIFTNSGALTSAGTLTINTVGSAILGGTISGTTALTVNTQADGAGNAHITVAGAVGVKTTNVTLNAGGSGNIIEQLPGLVTGAVVTLAANLGNIGTSTAIATNTPTLVTNTNQSGSGNALVTNSAAKWTLNNSTVGGSLNVTSPGSIALNNITAGDDITVISAATLSVNASRTITTTSGNITLNASNASKGVISLGSGDTVSAAGGNVTISIGSTTPPQQGTTPPANVSSSGSVFYGTNGIVAKPPTNTITAGAGRTITFSTGSLKSSAITLGGGNTITATSYENSEQASAELVVDTGEDGIFDNSDQSEAAEVLSLK